MIRRKNHTYEEIVVFLDLFDGKISINEVLDNDIPLLKELRDAKIRINTEVAKKRELENEKRKNKKERKV